MASSAGVEIPVSVRRRPRRAAMRWVVSAVTAGGVLFLAARAAERAPSGPVAPVNLGLDTANEEAFARSLRLMTARLSDTRKREFAEALVDVGSHLVGTKTTLAHSFRPLHGRTVEEIVEMARRVREGKDLMPPSSAQQRSVPKR